MILLSSIDVKSPHIYLRGSNTFDPLGLFSEQIFGNVKDYQCQCGKFSGIKFSGKRCDECNVLIGPSTIRGYTVSKIILPVKIPNPLYCMYSLPTNLFTQLKNSKDDFIIEEVIDFLERKANIIDKKIDVLIDSILVLPPTVRNVRRINKKNIEIDKLNYFYISILNYIQKFQEACIGEDPKNLEVFTKLHLTRTCIKLYTHIIHLLTKKEGMIRQSVLGKRNDFTGRAVITIDPTLSIDSAKIPYQILVGLFFPRVLHRMNQNIDNIDSYFYLKKYMYNPEACEPEIAQKIEMIIDEIQKHNVVYLNRQPTLHRVSIQAFHPIGTKNEAISLPPEVCAAFNADFDGDTMAVYTPLTEKAKEEGERKMLSPFQLLIPGSFSFKGFTHDFVLGAYYATKEIMDNDPIEITAENEYILKSLHPHTRVKIDDYITSAGRLYISELLKCGDITSPLTANKLKKILNNLFFKYLYHPKEDIKEISKIIYELRMYVINFATQYTLSILDFMPKLKIDKDQFKVVKKWDNEKINKLNECIKEEMASLELTDNIYQIITSGARGNIKQLMQTVGMRGFVRNTVGKLVTPPILSSLKEGYTPMEIILSSTGNRKGAIDKALNTATSGYLTRKLIFSLQHLLLINEDCGTNRGLKVKLTKENINEYILRNTTSGENIHPLYLDKFIGKEVEIRSPLFCKSEEGICKECYQLDFFLDSNKIGIIAAQSIGEPGTQMVMRTFHTGGAADIKTLDLPAEYFYSDENDIYYTSTNLFIDIDSDFEELPIKDGILQDSISFYVGINNIEGETFILPRGTVLLIDVKHLGDFIKKGTPIFKYTIEVSDLATDLHLVDKNLCTNITTTFKNSLELLESLKNIYRQYQSILSIYFEILWAERLRLASDQFKYVRFEENIDDNTEVVLLSLSNIPHSRLLLSLCFEDFRKFFKGFLKEPKITYSPLECLIQSDISKLRELTTQN